MKHVIRFKSFEDANTYARKEFYKKGFDPEKTETFFLEYSGCVKNPYKSGIYRFKSFDQARKYDMQLRIRNTLKKDDNAS